MRKSKLKKFICKNTDIANGIFGKKKLQQRYLRKNLQNFHWMNFSVYENIV